jgi:hypothetical protein
MFGIEGVINIMITHARDRYDNTGRNISLGATHAATDSQKTENSSLLTLNHHSLVRVLRLALPWVDESLGHEKFFLGLMMQALDAQEMPPYVDGRSH